MHRITPTGFASVCLTLALSALLAAQEQVPDAPGAVDLSQVQFRIVGDLYLTSLKAANATFTANKPNKYRGLVLTVEVTKPAGQALTLYAQDFAVHYYYGENSMDVAPCKGVSSFSTTREVDRAMMLSSSGRKASQTGTATSGAGTVYVDLFFDGFEHNSRELHLLLAQPFIQPYQTSGWGEQKP